jgi:hypothetical protein
LYWSAADGLYIAPLTGGSATKLASTSAAALAADGTNVYYVAGSNAGPGVVGFVPLSGGSPTLLASGRIGSLVAVAVDDQNVYWIEGEGTIQRGAVAAVPKAGGQVTVLASGLSDPLAIAVDGSGIYFANTAGGTIGRIPK